MWVARLLMRFDGVFPRSEKGAVRLEKNDVIGVIGRYFTFSTLESTAHHRDCGCDLHPTSGCAGL